MLPVTFQFIIAMVAYAINEQLARRIEYLLEEVRVLREVYTESTGRKRIPFTDEQRRRLAIKGRALTPEEREACCQIVRPATILSWFRQLACLVDAGDPEPAGSVGRIPAQREPPDPRPRPVVYGDMDGAAQVQRSQVRTHSGTKPQLQLPRGALRKNNTKWVSRPLRDLRGAPSALPDQAVYRALSNRTFSSGHW